ncbi:hypothetical protein Pmar_PMAR025508 [Perkinsus marinus ATCC 50983]|uniref:Uncharacterized protein n=1 Tax=Perkinsus marinus (strain ATCC 50983 / TXsc) TaxID=423536 RepID=C5LZ93_PERM5|nr:hypothetical protein Pmar_PMAR025508 [Perkinsus marinus ATCC 50983]EEQ97887.1 hypothetical protein Pmar_PMAR025508 [Perkinsus marinus ATCC 50983]|eukprot:XP_002765170.1 hypothetical protein Pmar_PMAR025508 [Perkinsus marinus ATCC 50983]
MGSSADGLKNRSIVIQKPKPKAEMLRVEAERRANSDDEYPSDFEEDEESPPLKVDKHDSRVRDGGGKREEKNTSAHPRKNPSVLTGRRASNSPPKRRGHVPTSSQRARRRRSTRTVGKNLLHLPEKFLSGGLELVDHSECVKTILLKKLKGKQRLLGKMLELARTTDYERFNLTARGMLIGAFKDPALHDPEEQTRIIHLSTVAVILENVRDRTMSSTVVAG